MGSTCTLWSWRHFLKQFCIVDCLLKKLSMTIKSFGKKARLCSFRWTLALALTTTWSLYPDFGFCDHYGRYLLQKKQILRSLYPKSLFMYWRRSVEGVAVTKSRAAALSKVTKPNGDCSCSLISRTVFLPFHRTLLIQNIERYKYNNIFLGIGNKWKIDKAKVSH